MFTLLLYLSLYFNEGDMTLLQKPVPLLFPCFFFALISVVPSHFPNTAKSTYIL